jgi:signal transduction histidine kinase
MNRIARNVLILLILMANIGCDQVSKEIARIEAEEKYRSEMELQEINLKNKELASKLEISKHKQGRNIAIVAGLGLLLLALITYKNYRLKIRDNHLLVQQKEEIITQKEEIQLQRDHIDRLNHTKDKFLAIIAHDLRNPLGGIFKLSEVIDQNFNYLSQEKLKKYINNIRVTSDKVYELLDNLLNWASTQTGKINVEAQTFNIHQLINSNKELLKELASQKQIEIEFVSDHDLYAYGDTKMVNTVIRNLLTNAIKFTGTGGKIAIDAQENNGQIKVSIQDNGIGIAKEDQKRLFDLLGENKNIGRSKEKGIGLGLVLCKEFVNLNKGEITVKSELGKGSTFYFTIPAKS